MLEAVLAAARGRGWRTAVVLPAVSAGSGWAQEMRAAGDEVLAAPPEEREQWVSELVGGAGGPVVLHSHFTEFDLASARATRARADAAAVWHFHTVLERTPAALARHVAKLALARRYGVAAILCPSDAMRTALLRRGAPRKRVHTLRTPIDASSFPLLDADARAQARERFGLPTGVPVLLHFGWDWQVKGGDRLLATIAALRRRGIDARALTRAGPGAIEEAARAGLSEAVSVQREPVADASELFGAADVLLATSRGEGTPFTVLESLCLGTPVVATDIPGHRPFAGAPAFRIVEPTGDRLADGVAETLGRAPVKAEGEAAASRNWVMRRFSLEEYARRSLELYGAVLGETAPGRTNVQYAERR